MITITIHLAHEKSAVQIVLRRVAPKAVFKREHTHETVTNAQAEDHRLLLIHISPLRLIVNCPRHYPLTESLEQNRNMEALSL